MKAKNSIWMSRTSAAAMVQACFLSMIILFAPLAATQASATVSLWGSLTCWKSLRSCGQWCLGGVYENGGIPWQLQCGSPIENECFCRADLVSEATSYLSSCIMSGCSNSNDVTSGMECYTGYCSTALAPVQAPATTSALTTIIGNQPSMC